MALDTKHVVQKLDHIATELKYLREHISDIDAVLTDDDVDALHVAEQDFKEGRTTRL